jgi:acyl-CoA thioesterase FadM
MESGELLFQDYFDYIIDYPNDKNGHLGNDKYFCICEEIRAKFLEEFGWSDYYFNEKGIAMRRAQYTNATFIKDIKMGEKIKISLEFLRLGNVSFDMHFKFFSRLEDLVFDAHTKDTFVDMKREIPRPIPIPEFFITAIKGYKEKPLKS